MISGDLEEELDARRVPPSTIAPHPLNLRKNLGDLSELEDSFREVGQIETITVVSMEAFKAWNPELWDAVEPGEFVAIGGHRRRQVALNVGMPTVKIEVDDTKAPLGEALKAMLAENGPRSALTPIEEARGFALLKEEGQSDREIAQARGVSHGQVSKRLKLLRLPEELQTLVESNKLGVADALKLLELPDKQLLSAHKEGVGNTYRGIAGVVDRRKAEAAAEKEAKRQRKDLVARGFELIPFGRLGEFVSAPHHASRLFDTTADDIDDPSSVVVTVRQSGAGVCVEFWQRRRDGEETASERSNRVSQERDARDAAAEEQKAKRAAAGEARAAACQRLLRGKVSSALVIEVLADTLLTDEVVDVVDPSAIAMRWCGVAVPEDEDEYDAAAKWFEAQAAAGGTARQRAALALALAVLEHELTHYHRSGALTEREERHLQRLVQHAGYVLEEWDEEQLQQAAKAAEAAA